MINYQRAYLYRGNTVVTDKNHINNATDNDFKKIILLLTDEFIKEKAEEIDMLSDEDDWEDEEN